MFLATVERGKRRASYGHTKRGNDRVYEGQVKKNTYTNRNLNQRSVGMFCKRESRKHGISRSMIREYTAWLRSLSFGSISKHIKQEVSAYLHVQRLSSKTDQLTEIRARIP